jgi:iron(III) transport system permease protein
LGKITLPLVKPGFISGWILLFVVFFRELAMVVLLYSGENMVISVLMFFKWTDGTFPEVCAVAIMQSIVLGTVIAIFSRIAGKRVGISY